MGDPRERGVIRKPEVLPQGMHTIFQKIARDVGTPAYVYSQAVLEQNADTFLAIPAPFGLEVGYAMKAWSNAAGLRIFDRKGLHFDASTFNEVLRAVDPDYANIAGNKIRLTSQEVQPRENLIFLASRGVSYTAGSLEQLRTYGEALPGTKVGVRFNPGIGSGGHEKTTTGGEGSPFGILGRHDEVKQLLSDHGLTLDTVHIHIGSGSEPEMQKVAMSKGLEIVRMYPDVTQLDMGGGFHVARMNYEQPTDIGEMGRTMSSMLVDFAREPGGRQLGLTVEPGTALVANNWILTEVVEASPAGELGYDLVKLNGGMNVIARNPMYGAEHPIVVMPKDGEEHELVLGKFHGICCETGDSINTRLQLTYRARKGDTVAVGGAGAYTSTMSFTHYNSQVEAAEVLIRPDGNWDVVREREKLREVYSRERVPADLR